MEISEAIVDPTRALVPTSNLHHNLHLCYRPSMHVSEITVDPTADTSEVELIDSFKHFLRIGAFDAR